MSSRQAVPAAFSHLTNLADDLTGTFVLWASDDYFAEKENLLKAHPAEWIEGKYTDKGKWMDGWESQRKREPGHDSCIIRLGTPGFIHGLLVDTTHFRGNAPQQVSLEVIDAPDVATPAELLARMDWREVLPITSVQPHHENVVALPSPSTARATHVRLHIYPDGGVARLRVFGVVDPAPRTFWRPGVVDVAAIENGGTVAAVSDQFFGPPSNLLLPGRGVNMGDGWETKRRRTPGSDWCVIRLGRRSVLERIELDTHFFKGNAPQACLVEYLDDDAPSAERLREPGTWPVLLSKTALVQHRRHVLEPERPVSVTHLRVHIFPHGGVNRMRVFGHSVDTPAETRALASLHAMSPDDAHACLLSMCGSTQWARQMAARRPFSSVRALFAAADDVWWSLTETDFLEAFAAHPRIGSTTKAASATAQSASWSGHEQRGVGSADDDVKQQLARLNDAYFDKHGFIYIVCATGKTASQMLEILQSRVDNTRAQEIDNAAREQAKITRLRLEKWLVAQLAAST